MVEVLLQIVGVEKVPSQVLAHENSYVGAQLFGFFSDKFDKKELGKYIRFIQALDIIRGLKATRK